MFPGLVSLALALCLVLSISGPSRWALRSTEYLRMRRPVQLVRMR